MLKKIEKYREVVEEIARLEKEIIVATGEIVELHEIDDLKKENKKITKLKEERDNYRAVQFNLINLFKKESDKYTMEFRAKLSQIAAEHQKQHDDNHREIAAAINKYVEKEKEINSSYSKLEAELEEKKIVEFLTKLEGKDYWNNSGITGLSNKMAKIKQKLINPMSQYGI